MLYFPVGAMNYRDLNRIADCRHASAVAFFASRFCSEVDGPNDRRYFSGIRRASGFVSAVS